MIHNYPAHKQTSQDLYFSGEENNNTKQISEINAYNSCKEQEHGLEQARHLEIQCDYNMRNKHYKSFSFRLDDSTMDVIRELKKNSGKSYNLLFLKFIKCFKKNYKKNNDSTKIN